MAKSNKENPVFYLINFDTIHSFIMLGPFVTACVGPLLPGARHSHFVLASLLVWVPLHCSGP